MDCLFCKIAKGDIPATIIKRTESITAFKDISPQAPTHVLIIPNKHFENIGEISITDSKLTAELFKAAADMASEFGLDSYRLNINTGAGAGQSVFHAHLHLLAGRAFAWPPG